MGQSFRWLQSTPQQSTQAWRTLMVKFVNGFQLLWLTSNTTRQCLSVLICFCFSDMIHMRRLFIFWETGQTSFVHFWLSLPMSYNCALGNGNNHITYIFTQRVMDALASECPLAKIKLINHELEQWNNNTIKWAIISYCSAKLVKEFLCRES